MQTSSVINIKQLSFGGDDIHLRTLKDKQQFSDKDKKAEDLGISSATWSLFGVIWPI